MRVALCTNYVSPYRLPVYRELSSRPGWDVTIFTTSQGGHDRSWKRYDDDGTINVHQSRCILYNTTAHYSEQRNKTIAYGESIRRAVPLGLFIDLIRHRPDVIISGELGMRTIIASLAGLITRTPVVIWTYPSRAKISAGFGRRWVRKFLLRSAPAIIGMGKTAREMLVSEGADPSRIFDAPNAADIETLMVKSYQMSEVNQAARIRTEIGPKKIAVVIGRLVQMKAPCRVLYAWGLLPEKIRSQWELVYIGDGPLKGQIESSLMDGVRCVGQVSPEEVAHWIKACDLHIFASLGDPWGLVVNEAMHLGKPTLCSGLAGCCDDLIINDVTGFRFEPADGLARFASILEHTLRRDDLEEIGQNARLHAASYTPQRMAFGMANAVEHAFERQMCKAPKENPV